MKQDYGFLKRRGETLCEKFYYCCTNRVMRPCVIVDYERELYVCAVCGLPLNAMGGLPQLQYFRPCAPSPQYVLEDGVRPLP